MDASENQPISSEEYKKVTEELYKQNLEVVRLYKQVDELNRDLAKANEGQSNLIHFINHQIKGYMSNARNIFAELAEEPVYGPLNAPAKEMVNVGQATLKEGVEFVQDILKASDIEKGTMVYNMTNLDFRTLVSEVAMDIKKAADDKGLTFNINIADGEYEMRGDHSQLKEAVHNLIDNSVKYTEKGSVDVSLSRQKNKILLVVKDTGVGLSDEVKPKLFTKGGRDKDSQRINVNSTGFGLSITKGVVDAHHGRVGAESDGPGKGSTFSMELPVA
jgi:signal transduction histidine kinase